MDKSSKASACASVPHQAASVAQTSAKPAEEQASAAVTASLVQGLKEMIERSGDRQEQFRIALDGFKADISRLEAQPQSLANEHKIRGKRWRLETWNDIDRQMSASRLNLEHCIEQFEALQMSPSDAEWFRQYFIEQGVMTNG